MNPDFKITNPLDPVVLLSTPLRATFPIHDVHPEVHKQGLHDFILMVGGGKS